MSGGISQLVAIGAQDAHLTGNPEVSFFRSNYKRHTNFAMTREMQVLQGTPTPGGMSTVRFDKKGDLLSYFYLYVSDQDGNITPNDEIITAHVESMELYIGGQLIDTETATSLVSRNLIGAPNETKASGVIFNEAVYQPGFTCCKYQEACLPLVALQYHDVEVRIRWKDTLPVSDITGYHFVASYIYLDDNERQFFANSDHSILIEQAQVNKFKTNDTIMDLSLNHPVKYITMYGFNEEHYKRTVHLQINGNQVGDSENLLVRSIQTARNNSRTGIIGLEYVSELFITIPETFCLQMGSYQPTGTLNFSRLDNASIHLSPAESTATDRDCEVVAVNYNVLRIQNGMGGLMYAN